MLATEMIAVCRNASLQNFCPCVVLTTQSITCEATYDSYVSQLEVCLLLILQRAMVLANFGSIGLRQESQLTAKMVCDSSTEHQKILKSDVKYVFAKC